MRPHEVAQTFFQHFSARNAEGMNALYAAEATFCDPVFGTLSSAETHAMWSLLCRTASPDFEISFSVEGTTADVVTIDWTAHYTFSRTGRRVENHVRTAMTVQGGLIVRQVDSFSLYRWIRQAMGPLGALLGWTPWMQSKLRLTVLKSLERELESRPA